MIEKSFPSYLQKDATKIADFLQQNAPKDFASEGNVWSYLKESILENSIPKT